MKKKMAIVLSIMLTACVSLNSTANITSVLRESSNFHGSQISLSGYLSADPQTTSLFQRPNDPDSDCIGLFATRAQLAELRQRDGEFITIVGRIDAERCGGTAICPWVCSPTVLVIDAIEARSDPN